ncbi:MAG: endopeptidase La [Candidatus Aminicenantes bacterium]|nr:endopeptidase La [Candidatus Aminicenantes bacterium]MDH5713999.1 endopeptidase La [Candidatus Aminicenantes bacterium]
MSNEMKDLLEKMKKEEEEGEQVEIPSVLPILPVREVVVYPYLVLPLIISRRSSIKLMDDILVKDKLLGAVAQKDPKIEEPKSEDLYQVGTAAVVLKMLKFPDNTERVIIQGIRRIKIKKFLQLEPYMTAEVEPFYDILIVSDELEALMKNVVNQFSTYISLNPGLPDEMKIAVLNIKEPGRLADFVISNLDSKLPDKQAVLETSEVKERLEKVTLLLSKELEILKMGSRIQSQIESEVSQAQREFFLRQQLKAIQKELGVGDERAMEIQEFKKKIKKAKMPSEVESEALKELSRLEKMTPASAEYTVSRTYLDWLVSLPWSVFTEDNLNIEQAKKVLDEDHYNLDKVKERILEYLAVRKLKPDMKGPILCFVGPPGTGKTSLGRSIARALGRKFIRLSLGGIRDEAEVRGHRRTYIGALPGRIMQWIRKAESSNPVFMLDEIDKLGADFRGDPAAALLEVLDPEQNFAFSDHYLEVPFDLSKVMFITTGNLLDPIPPALRDRMEVLELPGYTQEEKLMIARQFLEPKQLEAHGLKSDQIEFSDEAIIAIIRDYTREAGLRNLEREIASICRKVAKNAAMGKVDKVKITAEKVSDYLGPIRFFSETAERTNVPGVAVGVAWTPSGGDIVFVESTKMRGKKSLKLTGQLGDVMKESAEAALSYIRSRADSLGLAENFFDKYDLHIHIPAGSIPKDGPSAGVTIATSLISLLMDKPVRPDVAMSGEITLRGKVLPVGGIKEKVLAAKRAGIRIIILPSRNEKDLEEIPEAIKKELEFQFVDTIDEVWRIALRYGQEVSS